jgi:hypothetical protein
VTWAADFDTDVTLADVEELARFAARKRVLGAVTKKPKRAFGP